MERINASPKPVIRTGQLSIFLVCLLFSVVMVAFGAFFMKSHVDNGVVAAKVAQVGIPMCMASIRGRGFHSKRRGNSIIAYAPGASDIEDQLLEASQAIGSCTGFKLASFCAGNRCTRPGVSFTLKKTQATEGVRP